MSSIAFLGLLLATAAGPSQVMVEAGVKSPLGRHLCAVSGDERVSLVEGRLVASPDSDFARATASVGDCSSPEQIPIYVVPAVARGITTAWLFADESRLELRGGPLSRALIWWRAGAGEWKSSACAGKAQAGEESFPCEVFIPPDAARAALSGTPLDILRLPPGAPPAAGDRAPELWSATPKGATSEPVSLDAMGVPVQRIVLNPPVVRIAFIEAWREQTALPLAGPGIAATVGCRQASCWLSDDGASIVLVPPASGDVVTINVRLRERLWLRQGDGFTNTPSVTIPVARCQLRPLVKTVLGGTEEHRLPVALGDRCPSDLAGLTAETIPPSAAYIERFADDGKRMDVRLGHVPDHVDAIELRLLQASTRTVVGTARLDVHSSHTPIQVHLLDSELGELPVIPTNREVHLQWASADIELGPLIAPVELPGYYSLRREDGQTYIQGKVSTAGAIPLRFAYVPPEVPDAEPLAAFNSDVHFPIKPVNVPVSLAQDDSKTGGLFALFCRDGIGEREVKTGDLARLPFSARGSCWLKVDRRVLTPADGTQRIRVTASVTSPGGAPRGGSLTRTLVISTGSGADTLWIESSEPLRPFDHLTVQIAHDDQAGHYVAEGEASGLPARRYRMIFGDERLRLYGSAAVPTGLFRITKGKNSGVLQFSSGMLLRLVPLNGEGQEFPFDFEFGLLGTNLSGEADLSIVTGPGITVPLLNPQEMAKAAIGIHAWLEYVPTRKSGEGSPWAFVFGPSISFGDFGTNL